MRRRDVVVALAGAVVAAAARAQQPERMRRIGLILGGQEQRDPDGEAWITALRQGLKALGWSEGRNLRIDYRYAGGDMVRIQSDVAALVRSAPDLVVVSSTPALAEVKRATATIPIVFAAVNDPVSQGLVASLAHPGGNITGFTLEEREIIGKWLELLKEIAPAVTRPRLLFNPATGPFLSTWLREFADPGARGAELQGVSVGDVDEIEQAVARIGREPGGGLVTGADVFTVANRALIMSLAARFRLPAIYQSRRFAAEDGLMSYGPDIVDTFRRSAVYVDRILKGADPADLPVQQPVKFELVINLRTARALGLAPPPSLLAQADEVIE